MSTPERSRVPAGVTTGGQFAPDAKAESDVDLVTAVERDDSALPGLLDAAEKRLDALYRQGLGDQHGSLRLAATAACVRLQDPTAIGFELDGFDDDDDSMYVSRVIWALGEDGAEDEADHFSFEDTDLQASADAVALSYSMDGDLLDDDGENRFMIDDVIKGLQETEAARPGAAGAEVVERFRAEHLPLEASDADAVRALIADLDAWAKANGVDLARQFADATGTIIGDDLDDYCQVCGRTLLNGECPVHG